MALTPIIKTITTPIYTVGMGGSFVPMSPQIPQLWDAFLPRLAEIPHQTIPKISFGICVSKHQAIAKHNPNEFVYIAAVQVDMLPAQLPDGMCSTLIPAGTYAVFTHKGSLSTFSETISYIYGQWQQTIERATDMPDFEWYDHRFNPQSNNSEIDVYIPIKDNK